MVSPSRLKALNLMSGRTIETNLLNTYTSTGNFLLPIRVSQWLILLRDRITKQEIKNNLKKSQISTCKHKVTFYTPNLPQ